MSAAEIQRLEEFEQDIECTICSEPLDTPVVVVKCGHEFCKSWLEEWASQHDEWPLCRSNIDNTIKVPKLDLIIENYLILLQREREFIEKNDEFQAMKTKFNAISNWGESWKLNI